MSAPLPLAAAAARLRGRPGRPRKDAGEATSRLRVLAIAAVEPRLLDLPGTAAYLAVSDWTVRDLEAAGILKRVRIPLPNGELRKLLFDRADLDRLIAVWKDGA